MKWQNFEKMTMIPEATYRFSVPPIEILMVSVTGLEEGRKSPQNSTGSRKDAEHQSDPRQNCNAGGAPNTSSQ